jgi:hypothetical protein
MGIHENMRIVITSHPIVTAVYVTSQMEPSVLSEFKVVKRTGDTGSTPEQALLKINSFGIN